MFTKQYRFIWLLALSFFLVVVVADRAYCQGHEPTFSKRPSAMRELIVRFKALASEMTKNGYDISHALELNDKSKNAWSKENHKKVRRLLNEAILELEDVKSKNRAKKHNGSKEKPKNIQTSVNYGQRSRSVVSKTSGSIPIGAEKVRVIDTFPLDTDTISNNTLQNFHYYELNAKDGTVVLNINSPVIIQEYPYSDFKFQNNKAFGATESGQVNVALPYLSSVELNSRQGTIINMISQSGIGLARDFKSFDTCRLNIEHRKGFYDFSRFDFLVNAAKDKGIDCIGRITPHRKRGKGGLPEDEAAYLAYIKQIIGRYKGRVKYWQTLKEPEPRMRHRFSGNDGGLSPADAVRILKLSYTTIKSIDKDATVYFPGTGPRFKVGEYNTDSYFEKIISLGGAKYFDVLGFDAYVYDIEEQAKRYRNILKKYGYDKPLWVAQTGVPDSEIYLPIPFQGGGSPDAQCAYMVKAYAIAFALGIEKVFWGEFLDESKAEAKNRDKRSILWDRTGLFYTGSWIRKPGYFTHRLLATALHNFTTAKRVAPNIVKFTFANRSPVYLVWPN